MLRAVVRLLDAQRSLEQRSFSGCVTEVAMRDSDLGFWIRKMFSVYVALTYIPVGDSADRVCDEERPEGFLGG